MIIVSQDKDMIVNFEKITYMEAEKINGEFVIRANFEEDSTIIGYYKTEERAMEVLKSICGFYSSCEMYCNGDTKVQEELAKKYSGFNLIPGVYEMPKE